MPTIARANGPIDVFKDLYKIDHKLGTQAEMAHVSFMVSNIDVLHVDEYFGFSLKTRNVYGGSRMRGSFCARIFCARIIQLLQYRRFFSRFYTSVLHQSDVTNPLGNWVL